MSHNESGNDFDYRPDCVLAWWRRLVLAGGAGAVNATCSGNGKSPAGPPPLPLSIWAETRRTVSLALVKRATQTSRSVLARSTPKSQLIRLQ
jgi:hypothetical protein